MTRHPIPADQTAAVPYLIVHDGKAAITFYHQAFGAAETLRLEDAAGRIGHAELAIGQARFSLADEHPELGIVGPKTLGGTTFMVQLYVEDVDELVARAIDAGATVERPIRDEFYGDRVVGLRDPFGHRWHFSTKFEDVSPEEMKRRMDALSQ